MPQGVPGYPCAMASTWLVTGAAGFIGSHLCESLLDDGQEVVGIDAFDESLYEADGRRRWMEQTVGRGLIAHELDIRNADALSSLVSKVQPDVTVHMAALAGVRPSISEPGRWRSVNVDGLVHLLEALVAAGCPRLVFASSSSVYGNGCRQPFVEDAEHTLPISPYGATKRAGELICRTWAAMHDLSIGSTRLFTVFGERQRPDLAIHAFMGKVAKGERITMFGDGTSSRDYTYVSDIVRGLRSAAEALGPPGSCREWNLGRGEPIALAELIGLIGEVVGRDPVIEQAPMQNGDVDHTYADLSRSRAELGFTPAVSFQEGLGRQWAWMQSA